MMNTNERITSGHYAFAEGYRARCVEGANICDNPYKHPTAAKEWNEGFEAAKGVKPVV